VFFEIPVAISIDVSGTGMTTPSGACGAKRVMWCWSFVLAYVATPPDIISQTLLAAT